MLSNFMRPLYYIIFILVLTACSPEKPQDNSGPSDSAIKGIESATKDGLDIDIIPEKASRDSILTLNAKGFRVSDSKVEWIVNGTPVVNADLYQFKAVALKKGDTVQAAAMVKDKKILSNIVQIENAPPQVGTVKFISETNRIGIEAAGSDTDGDTVTLAYEWTKNGVLAGTGSKIDATLKRGDKISVKITPFDGKDYGSEVVIEREIHNSPPIIIEHKDYNYVGRIFTCNVKAEDADGDALTYALKTAPQGMTIDKSTGLIRWEVPLGFIGKSSFTVSVSDGYGGEATQELTFNIGE